MAPNKAEVVIDDLNAALSVIAKASPILFGAYTAFKVIWQATNPGKTEAEYIDYLSTVSETSAQDDAAWLSAHGYVRDAAGNWTKPPTI